MNMIHCPVCGQDAKPTTIEQLSIQTRGFVRRRVLVTLMNNQMEWVDLKDLRDVVYNSQPPAEADRSIKAAIRALKAEADKVGWTITSFHEQGNHARNAYILTPIMEGK